MYADCADWFFLCPFLETLRGLIIERLSLLFDAPADAFAAGLLMGARATFPPEILAEFRITGLIHIVAISGFNMVLIMVAFERLLAFLPRRAGVLVTLIVMGLFVLLVGATGAVMRAYVMCSVRLVARLLHRPSTATRAFFLTVIFLIVLSPKILADIGFQLSVAATAALLFISPRITEKLSWVPEKFALRSTLASTVSVEITTIPLIFLHFQTISFIAPLANILVVPIVPFLMLGSGLSLVFGIMAAAPTQLLFNLVLWLVHGLASLPYASV